MPRLRISRGNSSAVSVSDLKARDLPRPCKHGRRGRYAAGDVKGTREDGFVSVACSPG